MPTTPTGKDDEDDEDDGEEALVDPDGVEVDADGGATRGPPQGVYFHHQGALLAASTVMITVMTRLTLNSWDKRRAVLVGGAGGPLVAGG